VTRPALVVRFADGSPLIEAVRGDLTHDQWSEVAIVLADELPAAGRPMFIRPARLIRQRSALRGLLRRHGIDLAPSDDVRELLLRSLADERALDAALDAARADPNLDALPDLGNRALVRDLRPFQLRDLQHLLALPHGANFSVPGAGKTTVGYVVHAAVAAQGLVDRLLVVAPLSAFGAWEEDSTAVFDPGFTVERWRGGPIPGTDVVLVNYQRLPGGFEELTAWMARHRVHLVADEAHRAKRGSGGGWGRALLGLAPLAVRRDVLTGTPAPNHPRDLVALLDVLWPDGRASRRLPSQALQADPPMTAMQAVNDVIRPLYVRTTKDELQLPDVAINPMTVRLGPLQRAIYDAMLDRYAGMFDLDRQDSAMFAQMGEVTMYLLQAASSPKLLATTADAGRAYRYPPLAIPAGSRLAQLVESFGDHEVPAKIAHACALVRENVALDRKTLVWSNFPENLLDLEQQLAALEPAVIYGAVPSGEDAEEGVRTREREIQRFRRDDDCKVLLANPAALAEGVSLHRECHDAIYIDRSFNAGQYLQSLDRIHRLGLRDDEETRITLLIAEGTIDERVDRRVAQKARRLAEILADRRLVQLALPDDDDYGPALDDPADLAAILSHLREGVPARDA
jgi:hypothetical protein